MLNIYQGSQVGIGINRNNRILIELEAYNQPEPQAGRRSLGVDFEAYIHHSSGSRLFSVQMNGVRTSMCCVLFWKLFSD